MINLKKIDEKDFVFINKALNEKEDKEFSDFLRNRKKRKLRGNIKKRNEKITK
jgi:hypothetical protein